MPRSHTKLVPLTVASVCYLLVLQFAFGQEAQPSQAWKVGLAQQKITPKERIYLSGYASRNKPFESVADDLFVKAVALEDATGRQAILITSDVIGFRADLTALINQQIRDKTGLKPHQILINSSHTHTGPTLSLDTSQRSRDMTDAQARATVAYTKQLIAQTAETAIEAYGKRTPARLALGTGVAKFVMNRREPTPRGVRLGVNPSGLADRAVPVLRIDDPDGKLRAVLYQVACHNTTLGSRHFIVSGDFAGISQTLLQEQFPGVQAMFMAGCGGSANPYPRGDLKIAQTHGREVAEEVARVLDRPLSTVSGPLQTLQSTVDLPLQKPPSAEQLQQLANGRSGWQPWVAEQMKEQLDRDGKLPRSYPATIAVWQFGSDLTLVGLPGEVVVDYVTFIRNALGPLNLWVAAYCNDVFGYIPSRQVLLDGGYETRGLYYGGVGFFAMDAEQKLVQAVRDLADLAGRDLPN